MKVDIKSILVGIVIGIFGVTLFFFVIGEAEIKTNMQFGEKVDEDDKDIIIQIKKIIDDSGKEEVRIKATGSGSVAREDMEAELRKIYEDQDIDVSSENVSIEIIISN